MPAIGESAAGGVAYLLQRQPGDHHYTRPTHAHHIQPADLQYVFDVHQTEKQQIRSADKKIEVIYGSRNIGVRGEDFELLFSQGAGGLVSYRYKGREYILSMPKPNFWRAPVDNDYGNHMEMRYARWKLASLFVGSNGKAIFGTSG